MVDWLIVGNNETVSSSQVLSVSYISHCWAVFGYA